MTGIGRLPFFLLWIIAFAVSVFAVSNLMPLLLQLLLRRFTIATGVSIAGYLIIAVLSLLVLAWGIYRLDRRAGRIRNKVGWFE